MKLDELRLIKHKDVGAKRFGYWVVLQDSRKVSGKVGRKSLINFVEASLGPLGVKWQYELNNRQIILKLDNESDLLFFLLKVKHS